MVDLGQECWPLLVGFSVFFLVWGSAIMNQAFESRDDGLGLEA